MLAEVLHWLDPQPGQILVDGTLGGGGHTRALAERVGPGGLVLAFDRDPQALAAAERQLAGLPVKLVAASYRELGEVLAQLEIERVDGILLDLGLSSDQLADNQRGFSFDSTGELDLRFDPTSGEAAWQLVARLDATELADVIYKFGEERHSRRIARNVVEARRWRRFGLRGNWPRWCAGACPAAVMPSGSTRPRGRFRLCESRSTTSWGRWKSRYGSFPTAWPSAGGSS